MGNIAFTYTNGNVGTAAATAVSRKDDRKYFACHNTHATQVIYAKFGATAASLEGHVIKAGESLVFDGDMCPVDYFSVYGSGATTTYAIAEGF